MKADKTTDAPEIDKLLKSLGNETTQIPFYAIYPADSPDKPRSFNGVFLTPNQFLKKIRPSVK